MTAVGRWVSAVLATYAISRLCWRVPLSMPSPARLWLVHGLSALVIEAGVLAVRGPAAGSLIAVAVAQAGWLLLDRARGLGIRAPASPARAARS